MSEKLETFSSKEWKTFNIINLFFAREYETFSLIYFLLASRLEKLMNKWYTFLVVGEEKIGTFCLHDIVRRMKIDCLHVTHNKMQTEILSNFKEKKIKS